MTVIGKIHNFPRNSPADFTQYMNEELLRANRRQTIAKILHRGKNKIAEPVPVHGFGVGPTKTKAKSGAMDIAHGFAILVAARRATELKCTTDEECPKMVGLQVANEKTAELVTVKLQNNLYLSVVSRSFDIVIVCQ